jgi:dihydroorotate dehydrogenase electron transfer subunit
MIKCENGCTLPRPFSIHKTNDNGDLALWFAVWEKGRGTTWLSQQKSNDDLNIFGPLGNGFTLSAAARNVLLVAGGVGIAPLVFLTEKAAGAGKKVTLIHGARMHNHLLQISLPQKLFDGGMHPANVNVVYATEDGSEGFKGLATQLVPHYLKGADQVFACGPAAMYKSMAAMPELKGKDVQLSLEIMMGCGVGVCYGCTIKTKNGLKQVCQDGPVFQMGEII